MLPRLLKSLSGMRLRQEGAIAVEFAFVLPVLLVILAGIMDFGHAFYMKQVITNASREGARYGITYKTNSNGVRIPPNAMNPTIQTKVNQYLTGLLPSDANPTVSCAGTGYSSTNPSGLPLNVIVSARKNWWLISNLIPSIPSYQDISVTTTMNCE